MTSFRDLMLRKKGAVLFALDGLQSTRDPMMLLSYEPGGLLKNSVVVALTSTSTSQKRPIWHWSKAVIAHAARLAESEDIGVAVFDVQRAYFYAEEKRGTFVELPGTMYLPSSERHMLGSCARHRTELAQLQHRERDELRKGLISCNLTVGTVSRCCFQNASNVLRCGDGAW